MPAKRRGKWANWRCVRREVGASEGACVRWLLQSESHTALIDRYDATRFTWGVCPRIPKASMHAAVETIWYTESPDECIGRWRARSFEEARQAVQCWIAEERKQPQQAPQPEIEEEEITYGQC